MENKVFGTRTALALTGGLWLFLAAAYILLRSNQYTSVDGALRCLAVFWHRHPYIGPNNHMLHLLNVYAWSHLCVLYGIQASDPIAFLHTVQTMNAICAAGSVALVNLLVWRFTRAWKVALVCAVLYGLSRALLMHATNSAEPVVGLFISLVACLQVTEGLALGCFSLLFLGGGCLALALANYESMFLVAPLLYLLCLVWPTGGVSSDRLISKKVQSLPFKQTLWFRVFRLASCVCGTVVTASVIYGAAYYNLGIKTPAQMLRTLMQITPGSEVYGGVHLSKVVNVPVGLIANLVSVLPVNYQGIRWLLASRQNRLSLIALAGVGSIIVAVARLLVSSVSQLCGSARARLLGSAILGVTSFELFPQFYWDPLYDKLWLQPIALGIIFAGLVAIWTNLSRDRRFTVLVVVLIAAETCANLPLLVSAHMRPTRCLEDAQTVAAVVRPGDKVVTDFDPVSQLWMALYDTEPSRTLVFPATTATVSLKTLRRWTDQCAHASCHIFFVSLLDQSKQTWDSFLGGRVKVPYAALDGYRQGSRQVRKFACESDFIWVYDPTGG